MRTVNIHEAKTKLSRLIEGAVNGEPFIIAKAGKPLVQVTALEPPTVPSRLGFMDGQISIPDDFDTMGQDESKACSVSKIEVAGRYPSPFVGDWSLPSSTLGCTNHI